MVTAESVRSPNCVVNAPYPTSNLPLQTAAPDCTQSHGPLSKNPSGCTDKKSFCRSALKRLGSVCLEGGSDGPTGSSRRMKTGENLLDLVESGGQWMPMDSKGGSTLYTKKNWYGLIYKDS